MFHKKKITLVEQKNEKKMYSARPNVKCLNYVILVALICFVLLMILGNVKSKSYYRNLHASSKALDAKSSVTRSISSLDEISNRAVSCTVTFCSVICTGDMTGLNTYLNNVKNCQSMSLTINECTFPDDRLKSDWLKGSYNINYINITRATLTGIDNGAFEQSTVAGMTELKLDKVQLGVLTENTFIGLESVDTFTLVNEVEVFSGDGFLKPMVSKLKSVTIKHVTSIATDPTPWLRGGNFPKLMSVVLNYSYLGGYITLDTFQHLKQLQILSLSYCKINYLPDGIFDFMIGHLGVYIFVDNNELKRLAGNYLSKIKENSLKYVQLQNNPWECTCELEELITEYTRYSAGFGTPAECSTPSQHTGKSLKQVVVDRCEDTTTVLTTTPSTTTLSTTTTTTTDTTTLSSFSSSTTVATEPSTEPPPDSTPDSTQSSSTTTLSTPTTGTTTLSTLSSSTSEATEPPANTTPNSITSPVTTTPSSTNPTEPSSTNSSTTSPQNQSTTMSPDKIVSIECNRGSVDSSESMGPPVELARPDTQFNMTFLSETSALMTIEETADGDLALIWFYDQPVIDDTGREARIVGEFKVGCQSDLENSLLIEGLIQSRAYSFCLVKEGAQLVSPFNCLSYYTSEGSNGLYESEVWLKHEDKALIIGLFALAIVISVCIGAVGMFLSLCAHPVLLKGSKRVVVVNRSTEDVPIMPRPRSKSSVTNSSYKDRIETNTTIRRRRSSETTIQSGRSYMMANNYEEIEYECHMNVANDMIYANRIPKSPPPPLPKRFSQGTSSTKEKVNKTHVAVVNQNENYYEDIS